MNKYTKFLAASVIGLTAASNAQAAGYQLSDYSVSGLGRAYAGAGVVGDDYSALAYNPAGMFANPKTGAQVGVTVVQQYGKAKGYSSLQPTLFGKEDISVYSPLPNFFSQFKVNDDLMVGLGVYMPYGLASDYSDDWFGKYEGVTTDLRVADVNLSVAYKLIDTPYMDSDSKEFSMGKLSFGAGLIYRYIRGKITGYLPPSKGGLYYNYDLDSWNWYGNFGLMWEPTKDTRFGISYRPTRHQKVEGPHKLGPNQFDGTSTQVLPEQLILSAYTKQDKIGYSFTARWSRWTRFQDFTLYSSYPDLAKSGTDYKWHNTWTVSLGADWYYNDTWTFRGGVGYDQSPATDGNYRTTRIPDQSRYWVSLGFTYNVDKKSRIDVGYSHLFMRTYHARNGVGKKLGYPQDIKYDAGANILGVQYQYDF